MNGQRGQAAIETLIAAPLVVITIAIGGFLMYLCFAKTWMTRSAREAAACLVSTANKSRCRQRLEGTLKTGLIFGRTEILVFRTSESGSRVEVSLDATTPLMPAQLIVQSFFPRKI